MKIFYDRRLDLVFSFRRNGESLILYYFSRYCRRILRIVKLFKIRRYVFNNVPPTTYGIRRLLFSDKFVSCRDFDSFDLYCPVTELSEKLILLSFFKTMVLGTTRNYIVQSTAHVIEFSKKVGKLRKKQTRVADCRRYRLK